jgi:hypothetical protein
VPSLVAVITAPAIVAVARKVRRLKSLDFVETIEVAFMFMIKRVAQSVVCLFRTCKKKLAGIVPVANDSLSR